MKKLLLKLLFLVISISIVFIVLSQLFKPILKTNSLNFPFAVHPFDIATVYPETWNLLKTLYFVSSFFSFLILLNKLFNVIYSLSPEIKILPKTKILPTSEELSLFLEIDATTKDNKTITYTIPIKLNDNCK